MDDEQWRRKIKNFSFDKCKKGNQGFQRILLQLFGYVGHGKSSFINSVICAWFKTNFKNYANAAGTDESHTTQRLTYGLTNNIVLVDNRGCASMSAYESGEIFAQLGNLLPLDQGVGWSKGFGLADRIVEAEPLVKASDFIIPIFVYSVKNYPTPDLKDELKKIFKHAQDLTAVIPIVVLTNNNHPNYKEITNMFTDIGTDKIFALENYTEKSPRRKVETDSAVIRFLYEVIGYAEFQAEHRQDPDQEMMERKWFVLKFIHERELKTQTQNLQREIDKQKANMEQEAKKREEEEGKMLQKIREQYQEKEKEMQQQFERERLRKQYEHEQRMKELEKKIGKNGRRK
ncbi:uncharacterized protein [Engystomops pustulosus]|uniref:uncharacterized protein n=1 Tax=Engystomops pustulosus TaxID=76066 RepID=UPI003AFAA37E